MPTPTRSVVWAHAVLALFLLLLTACGGGEGVVEDPETPTTSPQPPTTEATTTTTDSVEPVPLRLAFDGENCTYEGPAELTPGPIELTFLNDGGGFAAVNLVSIDEGYTIQDVIDDLGPEPSTGHHPPWTREIPGPWRVIGTGESHSWEGGLQSGLYAAVCARMSPLGVWFGFGLTVEG